MSSPGTPGEFEQLVLLTLAGFDDEASGSDVYEALVQETSREVSLAAVYITLTRVESKGWAELRTEPPAPEQGGRPRKFFRLSPQGAELLRGLREQFDRLWHRAASHPGLGAGEDR